MAGAKEPGVRAAALGSLGLQAITSGDIVFCSVIAPRQREDRHLLLVPITCKSGPQILALVTLNALPSFPGEPATLPCAKLLEAARSPHWSLSMPQNFPPPNFCPCRSPFHECPLLLVKSYPMLKTQLKFLSVKSSQLFAYC